jgi:hypothetical protein
MLLIGILLLFYRSTITVNIDINLLYFLFDFIKKL